MSKRTFSEDPAWNQFGNWIISNGGYIHESLRFSSAPCSPSRGSAVVTSIPIAPETVLLACPHTLVIDYSKAIAAFPEAFTGVTTPHAGLCFFLCKQLASEEDSFWWPYLGILPREFDTPLYFSEEDMKFLKGSNLGSGGILESRKSAWKDEWSKGVQALKDVGEDVDEYSWDRFLWAATIFTSRSFPGRLLDWDNSDIRGAQDNEAMQPALFPLIDCLNHRPGTKITWQPGASRLSVISVDGLESGVEVYNNYGPKANEELLLGYGFALSDNPVDTVTLRFMPQLDPHQLSIRNCQAQPARPGIYHLLRDGSPIYPSPLIALFHILTASPAEIKLLEENPDGHKASVRNEIATHTQLYLAMRRKLSGFNADPGEPKNEKQKATMIYRDGQVATLQSAMAESQHVISSLLEEHEGTLFVTLDTIVQDEVFADAVTKVFGTANADELRSIEQDDMVFVLYILVMLHRHDSGAVGPMWSDWLKWITREYDIQTVESTAVKEAYESVIPVALERAPEVFEKDEFFSEALLGWAMRVYQCEGVETVVEDKGKMFLLSLQVYKGQ